MWVCTQHSHSTLDTTAARPIKIHCYPRAETPSTPEMRDVDEQASIHSSSRVDGRRLLQRHRQRHVYRIDDVTTSSPSQRRSESLLQSLSTMSGATYSPLPTYAPGSFPDPHPYPPSPNQTHHYYPHRWRPRWPRPRPCIKYTAPVFLLLIVLSYLTWEPHIEISIYWRSWVRQEIEPITPLRGCFNSDQVSPSYNVTERLYGPRYTDLHAGMPMRLGFDCYDFAGTIRPVASSHALAPDRPRTNYHTYWRADLAPFSERQEYTLKSFFATQHPHSRLILWSNGDLSGNALLASYVARYPGAFELRVADVRELSKGTPLENSPLLSSSDEKAWLDGDLIRLLVMWRDGGVYVDMDTLFTRDLTPLLEHEFVTQWDCYGMSLSSHHHHPGRGC